MISSLVVGQENFSHPELEWQTIETKHFLVHFHNGTERTAHEVAKIAESVYGPITTMYGHEPDQRVSIIVRDHDDYSNGGAYFYDNKIEIWAPALDFELRGTHPWLWGVLSHEFTHIIQIQTAMKFGRKVPGIYFQWLGYEAERRPDVLYGYPNVIVSYPLSGFVIPNWFAEGVAQYSNPTLGYDYWDSHRDMILRMYMIDGNPLSWEEMGFFGKTSLGSESVYNSGFSLVEYIGQKYGIEKLHEISRQLSAPFCLTINGAIETVIGKKGLQLYEEWKATKMEQYKHLADSLNLLHREEEIVENEGFGNFYPVFSPDGSKIAYISNKRESYFSSSSIFLYDRITKESKMIVPKVRSSISFSPDGQTLYYAKVTHDNPHWSGYSDLFRFNLSTEKEERLTHGLRALNPKLSSDGKKLVFAVGSDGTLNVGVCNADGKNAIKLTAFQNGEQVYTPVWSKDGRKIAFGYSIAQNQSVALIDSNGGNFQILSHTGDCRNPFFASDSMLYYSWDRGGIFNIYALNIQTGFEQQITNVLGGAFLPTLNDKGNMACVSYTSSGYKISMFPQNSALNLPPTKNLLVLTNSDQTKHQGNSNELEIGEQSVLASAKNSLSENKIFYQSRPYRSVFSSISFIPLIRVDNYNESSKGFDVIKPGLFLSSSEVLDKMNFFGGGAINRKLERDLFLSVDYRDRLPILYKLGLEPTVSLELYNITRKRDVSFNLYVNSLQTFNATVTYNLFEFDFSLAQKIISESIDLKIAYSLSRYSQDFSSWFHPTFGVIPASQSTYFVGNTISSQIKYDGILSTLDKAINPVGRSFSLKYFYDINKFNPTDSAKYKDGFTVSSVHQL